jgi:hypothetical protein
VARNKNAKPREGENASDGTSHAPARAIPSVAERVNHIVGMMERFEWDRGKSAPELAKLWGLAVATVEGHSAEAHRRCVGDKDTAIRDITVGARRLFIEAVNMGDAKAAKAIGDLWADVAGAKAPAKSEISGSLGIGEATPAAAAELVRAKFGGHAAKRVASTAPPEAGGVPPGASEQRVASAG